jgi:hypothetical protein
MAILSLSWVMVVSCSLLEIICNATDLTVVAVTCLFYNEWILLEGDAWTKWIF